MLSVSHLFETDNTQMRTKIAKHMGRNMSKYAAGIGGAMGLAVGLAQRDEEQFRNNFHKFVQGINKEK
jgi:CRISPR/Cas system CSM-associated protein Csm2 small subunit